MEEFIQYGHLRKTNNGLYYFDHIYTNEFSTEFCDKTLPVYELTFVRDENQDKDKEPVEYWGWLTIKNNKLSMIYPRYFLFNMCFSYGAEESEKHGEGKAIKLKLIKYKLYGKNNII